jgi:hypothetical protein
MMRKFHLAMVGVSFAGLVCVPAAAQQATLNDPLLDHLAGRWVLSGTMDAGPTTHDIEAQWVLAHQYLELHEVSREKNRDGAPAYQATVYIGWDTKKQIYDCVWLDDYGSISTQSLGYAKPAGNSIAFVFQDRDDPGTFHTTFTWHPKDETWSMDMDQETSGKLTSFARTVLKRAQ